MSPSNASATPNPSPPPSTRSAKAAWSPLVGNLAPSIDVPLQYVVTRQIRLQGSCASNGEYPQCIDLMAKGVIKVAPLISLVAPLSQGAGLIQPPLPPRTEPHEGGPATVNANLFDLTGRVALVTGTSRGLGQYMARALARAGADLVITSRKLADLEPFRAEVEAIGRKAFPVELDVRSYDSIQHATAAAIAHLRQDRYPGQQCRPQRPQACCRNHLGRLEPRPRNQPPR